MLNLIKIWFLNKDFILIIEIQNIWAIKEKYWVVWGVSEGLTFLEVDLKKTLDVQRFYNTFMNTSTQDVVPSHSDLPIIMSFEKYHSWPFNIIVVSKVQLSF